MIELWQRRLRDELRAIENAKLFRQRTTLASAQNSRVVIGDQNYLNFSSNDYLGLASNEKVKAAFQSAVDQYGVGSGSSHLVSGHSEPHEKLEQQIAAWTGRDRALVFSS